MLHLPQAVELKGASELHVSSGMIWELLSVLNIWLSRWDIAVRKL
jgi:hypothetical protein